MKECLRMLNIAISQDSKIVTSKQDYGNHPGNDPKYLDELGLSEQHLRRLEKLGHAIKAYTKNIWLPGEEAPDKKEIKQGMTARGQGMRIKWLLFAEKIK